MEPAIGSSRPNKNRVAGCAARSGPSAVYGNGEIDLSAGSRSLAFADHGLTGLLIMICTTDRRDLVGLQGSIWTARGRRVGND